MVRVNILYENEIEDVDIILVPKEIANKIETVTQKFFNWIFEEENKKRFQKENEKDHVYTAVSAKDFIWWINKYEIHNPPYASLVEEHTTLCSDFPIALF